jgi:CRISPR-associated endoribonuclease Cas6
MRLKLNLKCRSNGVVSMNYTYALETVILKILESADPLFNQWLLEKRYDTKEQSFKLFTFDLLRGNYTNNFDNQTIKFLDGNLQWRISFCVDEAVERLILNMFQNRKFNIVTTCGTLECVVQKVELIPPPRFSEKMRFNAIMPICISENKNGGKYPLFLQPNDRNFEALFFNDLKNKYDTMFPESQFLTTIRPMIKIISAPKAKKFEIVKRGSQIPITIQGYIFNFEITAPIEWIKIGYNSGFGIDNSCGFGYSEILT